MNRILFVVWIFACGCAFSEESAPPVERTPIETSNETVVPSAPEGTVIFKPVPEPPIPSTPLKLLDVFSSEKNPGRGKLNYLLQDKTETFELGAKSGLYAIALSFTSKTLPPSFTKDVQSGEVLQLVMGRIPSPNSSQVPQFGAATLISAGKIGRHLTFPLAVPSPKTKGMKNVGLLLFTSPQTPTDQTDEQKLKGTYLAESGNLTFNRSGREKIIQVKHEGETLRFKLQPIELEFNAKLVTPFNVNPAQLTGTVELPLYAPLGKEAEKLMMRLATESMGSLAPPPAAQLSPPAKPREVTGK